VSVLGTGVDELHAHFFKGNARSLIKESLAEGNSTFLRSNNATLEHEPVVLDNTVVGESTHRCDVLFGQVVLGRARFSVALLTHAVDLLVDFGTVVVSLLTSAGHSARHARRVPCSNTSNLAQTLVSLARKTGNTPTADNAFETLTLGCTEHINHLVLAKHSVNLDFLLEKAVSEVDLLLDAATVDLDFQDVAFLLAKVDKVHLSVREDTDVLAVLLHALQSFFDGSTLTGLLHELLLVLTLTVHFASVFLKRAFLAAGKVSVETTLDAFAHVLGPHSGQGAKSQWGCHVSNHANNNHGRSFHDGDSLNDFLLVELASWTVDVTENVGHSCLEAHKRSQVAVLGGIIPRERTNATTVVLGALLG